MPIGMTSKDDPLVLLWSLRAAVIGWTGAGEAPVPVTQWFPDEAPPVSLAADLPAPDRKALGRTQLRVARLEASDPPLNGDDVDNVRRLQRAVGLSDVEVQLLVLAVRAAQDGRLNAAVDTALSASPDRCRPAQTIASILGVPVQAVSRALAPAGALQDCGLFGADDDSPRRQRKLLLTRLCLPVTDAMVRRISEKAGTDQEFFERFYRPGPAPKLTLEDYPHLAADCRVAVPLLDGAITGKQQGVLILLYGPPGTGKTELARALVASVGGMLVEVSGESEDGVARGGHERLGVFRLTQRVMRMVERPVILLDEIDDAFERPWTFERQVENVGRAAIHGTMESARIPSIWITNDLGVLTAAIRRRFSQIIEVPPPPARVRQAMVRSRLEELPVSPSLRERLGHDARVTPAILDTVSRMVRAVSQSPHKPAPEQLDKDLAHVLETHLRATGGPRATDPCPDDGRYDLTFVNASIDPGEFIPRLREAGRARVAFYGPPGTGKTALAGVVARALDRPLLIKRGSDLLSKWVGESEQNIARMFAEASASGAVLLVDEADGLFHERGGATHRWELTQTNEVLAQVEVFDGILICSTNLMQVFDVAAMRRFDAKVRFDPLTAAQRVEAFRRSLEFLGVAPPPPAEATALRAGLDELTSLAIGDYRAAERRLRLGGELSGAGLLEVLREEHRAKRGARPVGFGIAGTPSAAAQGVAARRQG